MVPYQLNWSQPQILSTVLFLVDLLGGLLCECVCMCVRICVCVHVHGGQKTTSTHCVCHSLAVLKASTEPSACTSFLTIGALGLETHHVTTSGFYMGSGDSNSGPHLVQLAP